MKPIEIKVTILIPAESVEKENLTIEKVWTDFVNPLKDELPAEVQTNITVTEIDEVPIYRN